MPQTTQVVATLVDGGDMYSCGRGSLTMRMDGEVASLSGQEWSLTGCRQWRGPPRVVSWSFAFHEGDGRSACPRNESKRRPQFLWLFALLGFASVARTKSCFSD